MKYNIHIYSRVIIAVVSAIIVSNLMITHVFVAGTPRVRPDLADSLVTSTLALINIDNYRNMFAHRNNTIETVKKNLASIPERQIVPGVYAKENEETVYTRINYDEVQWNEIQYQKLDGTSVILRVPAGMEPPPPGLF